MRLGKLGQIKMLNSISRLSPLVKDYVPEWAGAKGERSGERMHFQAIKAKYSCSIFTLPSRRNRLKIFAQHSPKDLCYAGECCG